MCFIKRNERLRHLPVGVGGAWVVTGGGLVVTGGGGAWVVTGGGGAWVVTGGGAPVGGRVTPPSSLNAYSEYR